MIHLFWNLLVSSAMAVVSSPLDISEKGQFCAEVAEELPKPILQSLRDDRVARPETEKLWQLSQKLNSEYVQNVTLNVPSKLEMAAHFGVDIAPELRRLRKVQNECAANFAPEFQKFSQAIQQVTPTFSSDQVMAYDRMAAMALLENHRLETILHDGMKQGPRSEQGLRAVLLRLLILRSRFPFLQNLGWEGESGTTLSRAAFNQILVPRADPQTLHEAAYVSDERFDGIFGYDHLSCLEATSGEQQMRALYPYSNLQTVRPLYVKVYDDMAKGFVPNEIQLRLKKAVGTRVRQMIHSVELKCTAAPCATLALREQAAVQLLEARDDLAELRPQICACHIGHETQTISDWLNEAFGAGGAILGIACVMSPPSSAICAAALYSMVLDMAAGAAGIYDAEVNDFAMKPWAIGRTDAVPQDEEYETRAEVRKEKFNYAYNWVTGLGSFMPYRVKGRTTYRLAKVLSAILHDPAVSQVTLLESLKAASAIPAPLLATNNVHAVKNLGRCH